MRAPCLKAILLMAVIIPLSALAEPLKVPDLENSRMEIPWADFKKILLMIQPKDQPEPEPQPQPPAPYIITSAAYQGRAEAGAAAFEVTVRLTVLEKKQWVSMPVLPDELAADRLLLDGKPALVMTSGGWHNVVLLSPDDHVLTGRFYVPFGNRSGPRSFSMPLPRTPVTTLTFTVPEPGLDIKAEPANLNRVIGEGGATRLEAVLPPTDRVGVSWSKKVESRERDLRLNAEVESLVSLGERLCEVQSFIHYEILHKGVTGFELALPKDVSIVDVAGVGVADWKIKSDGGRQVVSVSLSFEARDRYILTVTYEKDLPDATAEVALPELEILGANRDVGHIGVAARTNIEVEVLEVKELGSLDVAELPYGIAARSPNPVIHAFKYVSHPWELKLKAVKHDDVEVLTCAIDAAGIHSYLTRDGELLTRAFYTVRNNRKQFMRVTLPEGARVFGTFRNGRPVQPARDKEGRVLIPLEKSAGSSGQARSFTVEIIYLTELSPLKKWFGRLRVEAPSTDIMVNSMEWGLSGPKDYRFKVRESSLEGPSNIATYPTEIWFKMYPDWEDSVISQGMIRPPKKEDFLESRGESLDLSEITGAMAVPNVSPQVSTSREGKIVQAALPVRFNIPRSKSRMTLFTKTIVQENEDNFIVFKYRKAPKSLSTARRVFRLFVLVGVIALVTWWLLRRRARRLAAARGVTS